MRDVFAKPDGITLVGGGAPSRAALTRALAVAPHLVAADGGADAALDLGFTPDLAVGDFDSISEAARAVLGPDRLRHDPDQESTDFDKVLAAVDAPLILGVGFSGARLDHTLAAMSTLAKIGESSRSTATLTSEASIRSAPNRAKISSPWRATTMPNGRVTATTGARQRVVTV